MDWLPTSVPHRGRTERFTARAEGNIMPGKYPTVSAETLASLSTPEHVDSRLGPLDFVDGAPSDATANLPHEHLHLFNGVKTIFDKSWRPSEIEAV